MRLPRRPARIVHQGPAGAVPNRNLRATFDWSYAILSPAEQRALCRLAALGKKFDIEAASGAISLPNPLTLLADLAAKSFLYVRLDGDRVLYEMLDTVRAYALEKLDSSHDLMLDAHDLSRHRHATNDISSLVIG